MAPPQKTDTALLADRYELQNVIARGGVGVVVSALDRKSRRQVAVKLLRPSVVGRGIHRARFRREAETAAGLRHPHLVEILDFVRRPEEG